MCARVYVPVFLNCCSLDLDLCVLSVKLFFFFFFFARALRVCVCVRLLIYRRFCGDFSLFPGFFLLQFFSVLCSLPFFSFFRGPPQKTVKPCSLLCSLISRISFFDFFLCAARPTKKSIFLKTQSRNNRSLSLVISRHI